MSTGPHLAALVDLWTLGSDSSSLVALRGKWLLWAVICMDSRDAVLNLLCKEISEEALSENVDDSLNVLTGSVRQK